MFLGRKLGLILQGQEQRPRPVPGGNLVQNEEKVWLRERFDFWTLRVNLALAEMYHKRRININLYQLLDSNSSLGWPPNQTF